MSLAVVILIVAAIAVFAGIMYWGRAILRDHPIRAVAVICVAIIGGFVMWMGWLHTNILASADWCGKAIQAERITPGTTFQGLTACVELLKIQVSAEAMNSHIYAGTVGVCLIALIVIVIAQGRAAVAAPGGFSGSFGPGTDPVADAANKTAAAATDKAKEIADAPHPTPPPAPAPNPASIDQKPNPDYNGPAMPEPPKGS